MLVVDDNETNRTLLERVLTAEGVRVETAASPQEALALAGASTQPAFSVAILDFLMPDMDGFELGRRLHALPGWGQVALVLLTSAARRGQAEEATTADFSGYLTKPVRRPQLLGCVRSVLASQTGGEERRSAPLVTVHRLAEAVASAQRRVLVVEDNPVNQKVAAIMLKKIGCRIDIAPDGLEALEALGRRSYHLVLMDCQMPRMDGYQATAEIRRREGRTAHTPIVAMTANAVEGDRERCLDAGMDDYLSKPVKLADLEAIVRRWTAGDGAVPAASQPDRRAEPQALSAASPAA